MRHNIIIYYGGETLREWHLVKTARLYIAVTVPGAESVFCTLVVATSPSSASWSPGPLTAVICHEKQRQMEM